MSVDLFLFAMKGNKANSCLRSIFRTFLFVWWGLVIRYLSLITVLQVSAFPLPLSTEPPSKNLIDTKWHQMKNVVTRKW